MFEYTEYELQKRRNKQELVRNEFKTVGKYQIPLIRKQDIDLDTISLISFSDIKQDDKENAYKTVHFFTYDWLFDKVYEKAADCAEKLKQYYALLSPDFSMFTDMPKALQIDMQPIEIGGDGEKYQYQSPMRNPMPKHPALP